nr:hypothetical protein [Piscicoccus intestinalis]
MPCGQEANAIGAGRPAGRAAPGGPAPPHERAPGGGSGHQRRGAGPQAEGIDVAGVQPAEQRVDERAGHLPPEPGRHEVADRDVGVAVVREPGHPGREHRLQPGAREGGPRHDAAAQHRPQLGGAGGTDSGGQAAAPAGGPQPAGVGAGGDDVVAQPELVDKGGGRRHLHVQRLGADVDRAPGDVEGEHVTADPRARLQHRHLVSGRAQPARHHQAADSGSDDDDASGPAGAGRRDLRTVRRLHR